MEEGASIATAPAPAPEPLTVGESMAHMSSCEIWTLAVFIQASVIAFFVGMVHAFKSGISPSFFSAVPWQLALWVSYGVYMSLVFVVMSCVDLFLPRAPGTVEEKLQDLGMEAIGAGALNLMVSVVLGVGVKDSRVLAGCTGVVAAFIVGLVAFWAWLVGRYGGVGADPLDSATADSRIDIAIVVN